MAVFKCKMCGGTLEIQEGESVTICEYCRTKQTIPRLDNATRANLYVGANHFRRNNEFDKAMDIYNQILNEDPEDAEAYWSIVLCRYGIEYVEDPDTHKQIPTVNRTHFTSVLSDEDYKMALKYGDYGQREIYEAEARAIDEIQKGILEISSKEEPFDVFICYKETDQNGRRTHDSVLANDLYHELTEEGYKVFFSRITLEDKIGIAYEPYIFAALNSAKVMVVLGTQEKYFNDVWVKNEWSRFLALIKNGAKKMLIPAYKGMDPYDLPEEFSNLQAQDMGKIGFMQDLVRGIKKLVGADEKEPAKTIVMNADASSKPLLKRVFLFLEDEEWDRAAEYCERVLDQDPENGRAYLGILMAELHIAKQEDLADCKEPFDNKKNYKHVMRFADDELAASLKGYIAHINERNEQERIKKIYDGALRIMNNAGSGSEYKRAAELFHSIANYKNTTALEAECLEKAEDCRKKEIYSTASKIVCKSDTEIEKLEEAIRLFESIIDWNDSAERIEYWRKKIEEIKLREERERLQRERREEEEKIAANRRKKRKMIEVIVALTVICALMLRGDMAITKEGFLRQKLVQAETLISKKKYKEAQELLEEIGDKPTMKEERYNKAMIYISEKDYSSAYLFLYGLDYKDSEAKKDEIKERAQQEIFERAEKGSIVYFGEYEQDNDTSNGKETIEWIVLKKEKRKLLVISRYALDIKQFDFEEESWKDSYIRSWLNLEFVDSAFSAKEQEQIYVAHLPGECTNHTESTDDKIFFLSVNEVKEYISDESDLQCMATAYVMAKDTFNDSTEMCEWWLRNCGASIYKYGDYQFSDAATVFTSGFVYRYGEDKKSYHGIRPTLWINLD